MSVRRRQRTFHANAYRERAATVAALMALPYLDAEQSAYIAQTSPSTIRRACGESGKLPHVRVNGGKLIRIAPDDLKAWLRALPKAS
jgi:hypothetical protein